MDAVAMATASLTSPPLRSVQDSLSLEEGVLQSIPCPPAHVDKLLNCVGRGSSLLCHSAIERFLRCLQKCGGDEGILDLVFHRTKDSSLDGISQIGFVAPDGENVKVAHGNSYGPGIYATWLDTQQRELKYGTNLVLCLALRGSAFDRKLQFEDGLCSHVNEDRELVVYRHGCQLLPIAVLKAEDPTAAEGSWQLAESIADIVFDMLPLVRGKWVIRRANRLPADGSDVLKYYNWAIRQWKAAEKFLSMDLRLKKEMVAVRELVGIESVCQVDTHIFQNSLDQWEVRIQTGGKTVSIGLSFPKCYPVWPPHMFLVGHQANGSDEVVSKQGGINVLKLMGLSRWEPAILVRDVLKELCPIIMEDQWALVRMPNRKSFMTMSMASYCGDGKNFWADLPSISTGPRLSSSALRFAQRSVPGHEPGKRRRIMELDDQATVIPEAFKAILEGSTAFADEFGGTPNFPDGRVALLGKVTRKEFRTYTAFEHLQLTVLGFARLSEISTNVLSLNNGATFFENPGTQLLEKECGLTMHADRPGASEAVKMGPDLMLTVFVASQAAGRCKDFFAKAFDRHHDPCLEGRFLLLQEFGQDLLAED